MLKERILKYLDEEAGRPLRIRDLARQLRIPEKEYPDFRACLRALVNEGRVLRMKGQRYGSAARSKVVNGHVSATRHEYLFVEPEGGGDDIFVGARATLGAMDGDRVQCRIRRRSPKGLEGEVIRILKHANETLVGYLTRERNTWFVVPENQKIKRDILVEPDSLDGAQEDDLVVVRVERWGSEHRNPSGSIIEVLGDARDPEVEMAALVRRAGLSEDFPEEVEAQAAREAVRLNETGMDGRLDLRQRTVFTIDPADAKDFDDAVSIERHDDGGWTIGVHIADVSHFVPERTDLDREAWRRGTSVYLVDRVIPMLPEALSNEVCSLNPGVDRLAFSCFVRLDPEGRSRGVELADSVIHSSARLTYEQAQKIIETNGPIEGASDGMVVSDLLEMAGVATLLTHHRMERGTIDFDLPEPIVELDERGIPVAVRERLRLASHRLVEEFMILANEAVAEYAEKLGLPFVYRIHDAPDPERMSEFREFVATLGYNLPGAPEVSPRVLSELLERVEDLPVEALINKVLLRHLRQAQYRVDNHGHFGLASRAYCHFTSPIRRYPDLVVHRLLRRYRDNIPAGAEYDRLEGWLRDTAEHASLRERAAMEAERESIRIKQVAYMEQHVGDVFPGYISGVTGFGFFVELEELLVDGLVQLSDLDDDYYVFDQKGYQLIGERTRKRYRLGDRIMIQVLAADRTTRELDFMPVPDPENSGSRGS
jgi:ribonuclease R